MINTSLVINSKDPNIEWLNKCLTSAKAFDEIIVYIDGVNSGSSISSHVKVVSDGKSRSIADGFNFAVSHSSGDWICPFCDDDFFNMENLKELLDQIKAGFFEAFDIIHYPVLVNGQYEWGTYSEFTKEDIESANMLPHGCMIKREAFLKLEGYKIDECADWNMWIRAKRMGLKFIGSKKPIYYFRHGHERSAYSKQVKEIGGFENLRKKVFENA